MNNYYDTSLIKYADGLKINYTVTTDISCYVEYINTHFPFKGGRIDFNKLNNIQFVDSNRENLSVDTLNLINGLLDKKSCSKNEVIIYIGDSLTDYGYEFYLNDILKIIPFIISEIPQHHYILFEDLEKIIFISMEDYIEFGTLK